MARKAGKKRDKKTRLQRRAKKLTRAAEVERNYRIASPSHQLNAPPASQSGNSVVDHARGRLADWGRHLDENHDITSAALWSMCDDVAHMRVVFTLAGPRGRMLEDLNNALGDLWDEWIDQSDAHEMHCWIANQQLIARTWFRDGSCFVRHFLGDDRPGRRVPYSFAAYEPDFVPFDLHVAEREGRNAILHGIEVDRVGRPVAAWMYRQHPSDVFEASTLLESMIRVPVEQLTHLRWSTRLGTYRGVSRLSPGLMRTGQTAQYEDSEVAAADVASRVAVQIKRGPEWDGEIDPELKEQTIDLQSGMVIDSLGANEELSVVDTSRPNSEMGPFLKTMRRGITASWGTSYSEAANDYDGTYSSQRQEAAVAAKRARTPQGLWKAEHLAPIVRNFITAVSMRARELRVASMLQQVDPRYRYRFDAIAPPPVIIDPQKEFAGMQLERDLNLESRRGQQLARGKDPARVDAEIAGDPMAAIEPPAPKEPADEETEDEAETDEQ